MKWFLFALLAVSCAALADDLKKSEYMRGCVDAVTRIALKTNFSSTKQAAVSYSTDRCSTLWSLAVIRHEVKKMNDPAYSGCLDGVSSLFPRDTTQEFRKNVLADNCL